MRTLFSKHGEVLRLVLPPSGVTAIVEFSAAVEAKNTFLKLAYSQVRERAGCFFVLLMFWRLLWVKAGQLYV